MTPLPTTTITKVETNVYTTNGTFYFSTAWGRPINLFKVAEGVIAANETTIVPNREIDGQTLGTTPVVRTMTETVVAGVTIQSPDAYYIYSRVRIMTASAILDDAGQVACVTDSVTGHSLYTETDSFPSAYTTTSSSFYLTEETLYATSGSFIEATATITKTVVISRVGFTTIPTTYTTNDLATFSGINSNIQDFLMANATSTQPGIEITLATPFLWKPERGNVPKIDEEVDKVFGPETYLCASGAGHGPPVTNYGYPPEEVSLKFAQNCSTSLINSFLNIFTQTQRFSPSIPI